MKLKKYLIVRLLLCVAVFGIFLAWLKTPFIVHSSVHTENFGAITIAQPIWGAQGLTLAFVDTKRFPADDLAGKLAVTGVIAAIVDSAKLISVHKGISAETTQCLSVSKISDSISTLIKELPSPSENRLVVSGIAEGALIPFLNAQFESENKATNLSIGFSIDLPAALNLCPPFKTKHNGQKHNLVFAPDVKTNWRSVWTDKPKGETAIFIKENAGHADTYIAAYNTPLDTLLFNELNTITGQGKDLPPMPIIEIPAIKASDTVTLFYSGDGGWRDLDRSVAEQMAALGTSVLGVDVLRYFWERKTPEQVASDLVATMRYYRTKWGVKSFVLAGFSFGADILPVIYNRLTEADKASIDLLMFLALGNHADFEVHVAGWLGQTTREMPLVQELDQIPKNKILCIYGKEEKAKTGTACSSLEGSAAKVLELPGGHHFDQDYPKLARLILDNYRQHGIN